ncbi:UDP-Glycosyltransferase/glycogen phosphorylase [Agrocybe pediades]|nr:UDP-Glycosyltransferase/glycogen phosphorylase [Agrocybe pediades]
MARTHVLFTSFPAWGHARSFCILAARLVKEYPDTVFSLLLPPTLLDKARDEVSSELGHAAPADQGLRDRIRIFSSFQVTSPDPFAAVQQSVATYAGVYSALLASESVTCATMGTVFEPVEPPSLLVMDFFAFPQLQISRSISGKTVPIFAWLTGKAASMIRMFGPESSGGLGDLEARMQAEASRLGVSPAEIGDKLVKQTSGKILKLPGVPEMYDYEFTPQKLAFEFPIADILIGSFKFFRDCDGVLAINAEALESESITAMRKWFSSWDNEVYAIGPLLPSGYGAQEQSDRGATEIKEFLERMLEQYGKRSVILVSFGTAFWPSDTTYMEEVVDAMIEKKFPFILAHASPFAKLTPEFVTRIQESGVGILSKWCPQQYILNHEATGWFLTHCGHNSVNEAIGSGIPMIAWPFHADQPEGAYHLTDAGLAIELLQVRTGEHASKPLRRNGKGAAGTREAVGKEIREVLDACRGEKGAQMRRNVEMMKMEFLSAWEKEGPARKELERFLKRYTDLKI